MIFIEGRGARGACIIYTYKSRKTIKIKGYTGGIANIYKNASKKEIYIGFYNQAVAYRLKGQKLVRVKTYSHRKFKKIKHTQINIKWNK